MMQRKDKYGLSFAPRALAPSKLIVISEALTRSDAVDSHRTSAYKNEFSEIFSIASARCAVCLNQFKGKSQLCKIHVRLLVLAVQLTRPLKKRALQIRLMTKRFSNTKAPYS
jgi:hypothetical protein